MIFSVSTPYEDTNSLCMFCRKLVARYRKLTYNDILLIHVHVILLVSVAKNMLYFINVYGACVKSSFLMITLMQEELTSGKPDTKLK